MTIADYPLHRRATLIAAGFSDDELRRMRRRGALTVLRRGLYIVGPESREAYDRHRFRVRATMEVLADGAVVSHGSAAVLHGLATWRVPLARATVTRARRSGGRRDRLVHMRTAPLDRDEVVEVDGLPVTSVARTVVDLARTTTFESAVVTTDSALAERAVTAGQLGTAARRCTGWPGSPQARRAVAFADGRAESVGESRSRVALAVLGFPAPVPQWKVRRADGHLVGRVDFGWPERDVVGEFDGRVKYRRALRPDQSPEEVVYAEKLREDALRAEGLTVVRWTWDELPRLTVAATRLRRALS